MPPARNASDENGSAARARLRWAAWLALAVHLPAGLAMAAVLRRGLETNPDLADRLRFLAEQTPWWWAAWLTWNAAALSILYFYAAFAEAHGSGGKAPGHLLRFAALLGAAGVALDLGAEAIEMGVLPELARQALAEPADGPAASLFLALHRVAGMLAGYLANGLYTLAAVVLSWSTRRAYARRVRLAGLAVGASGLFLSGAALVNSTEGMLWANVVLLPCLLAWLLGVAIHAAGREGQPAA